MSPKEMRPHFYGDASSYLESDLPFLIRTIVKITINKPKLERIMIHYKFVGVIEIPNDGDNYTADTRKGVAVEYVTKSA